VQHKTRQRGLPGGVLGFKLLSERGKNRPNAISFRFKSAVIFMLSRNSRLDHLWRDVDFVEFVFRAAVHEIL